MTDVFAMCRERVTARAAAEFYGYHPNRAGYILCPFHNEKTPSNKLRSSGTFHCYGCGASGSSIDFVALLYGLTPLEALRKLDSDFHLCLPLDTPATPQERAKAKREADRRAGFSELYAAFEDWRGATINALNHCIYLGNLVEKHGDPSELSDHAALALRERDHMTYLSDTLTWGTPEEQAQMWADRKTVEVWIRKVLKGC